jgi:hypothetical protein
VVQRRQIDNQRKALRMDPLIDEFIATAEAFCAITNRRALANVYADIEVTPKMAEIIDRRDRLEAKLRRKYHSAPPARRRRR